MVIIAIFGIVIFIYYIFTLWNAEKVKSNVLIAFTGSMGTGKTYHAVKYAIKEYKKRRLLKLLGFIKQDDPITLYSNIPVMYAKKRWFLFFLGKYNQNKWSTVLTREHLLMQDRLHERHVLVFDEVSNTVNQYEYDNPNAQVTFGEFIRFMRHYTDGRWFITAQSTGEIEISIRRKISSAYNLDNMRRHLLFFYKVDVTEVQFTEEIATITQPHEDISDKPYFFGTLPFKYLTFLNKIFFPFNFNYYDSRCFSENYKATFSQLNYEWQKYKTHYVIDLSATEQQIKTHKELKKKGINPTQLKSYADLDLTE